MDRRITGELRPGDTVALELTTRAYGAPAAHERQRERTGAVDRRKEQEQALREEWLDAKPVRYEVEAEAADGAFVETIAWTMPVVKTGGTPPHVPVFAGADDGLPRPQLGKRTVAVAYAYPRQLSTEVALRGFPAKATPPAPKTAAADGWSSTVSGSREGEEIRARWVLVLEKTDYPVERFGELKKLYGATSTASSAMVSWAP